MAKALEILRDRLTEDALELAYDNIDGIPTIRLILENMGVDEDGIVVIEVSEIPVEDVENYGYFHFMTIMANKLDEPMYITTAANLNRINMETLLGNYMVIEGTGSIAHKYVLKADVTDQKKAAEDLYNCLVDIAAIVNGDYDRVLAAID